MDCILKILTIFSLRILSDFFLISFTTYLCFCWSFMLRGFRKGRDKEGPHSSCYVVSVGRACWTWATWYLGLVGGLWSRSVIFWESVSRLLFKLSLKIRGKCYFTYLFLFFIHFVNFLSLIFFNSINPTIETWKKCKKNKNTCMNNTIQIWSMKTLATCLT